ncbi:Predicted integral membrane protein [Moraxella bovis]|uniref:Predicted integral membrane protein n=1 Tax=Moraxella bovis TaxID=476 RepID=A0A378PWF8_MORBO|nr:Predicted integral membrane protein [Moraxella bovis]
MSDFTLYQLIKTLHILSAMIILGTGFGTAFYLFVTNRSGCVPAQSVVSQWVCRADFWFTTPAVFFSVFLGTVAHERPKHAIFCHLDLGKSFAVFLCGGVLASCGRVATKNARHRQTIARQWRYRPTPILLELCQKMGIGRLSCIFGGIGDCVFHGI